MLRPNERSSLPILLQHLSKTLFSSSNAATIRFSVRDHTSRILLHPHSRIHLPRIHPYCLQFLCVNRRLCIILICLNRQISPRVPSFRLAAHTFHFMRILCPGRVGSECNYLFMGNMRASDARNVNVARGFLNERRPTTRVCIIYLTRRIEINYTTAHRAAPTDKVLRNCGYPWCDD